MKDKDDKPEPANKLGPLAHTDQKSLGREALIAAFKAGKKKKSKQ